MSLYNILFGQNPMSDLLLAILGLVRDDVARFRDCFISDGKIAVYTRNGGGNREHWDFVYPEYEVGENCPCPGCFMTYRVHKLPYYSHDSDDDFDSTYATIYFDFPPNFDE